MHSRLLWWLESGEDLFYPSPGVFHFLLVREEDAPFYELFFLRELFFTPEDDPSGPIDAEIRDSSIIQPPKNFGRRIRRSKRLQKKIKKFQI